VLTLWTNSVRWVRPTITAAPLDEERLSLVKITLKPWLSLGRHLRDFVVLL
jgi:hypothetical protein